ncbi:MAG: hypothetical protein ACYTBS_27630 [Planctomycetota bacterium]
MKRNKAWRKHERQKKLDRRLKAYRARFYWDQRFLEYLEKPRTQAWLADYPKNCRGACCSNPRRKSRHQKGSLTRQELKALDSYRSHETDYCAVA